MAFPQHNPLKKKKAFMVALVMLQRLINMYGCGISWIFCMVPFRRVASE